MSAIWLRIDGYPATEIAAHTPPTWETWADGGCGEASWAFALSPRSQHQALRTGALVEVMCGASRLWVGQLTEPDRSTWECHAYGLASSAEKFLALGGDGYATREIGSAVAQASAAGWPATNPHNISSTVSGDSTAPVSLAELISQHATATGNRWGVDENGALFFREDPVVPDWLAAPGTVALGRTNEDAATYLYALFVNSANGNTEVAIAGTRGSEQALDLTSRGEMTRAEVDGALASALRQDYDVMKWVNGVTLSSDQIQTTGGTPAFLPSVRAGQMIRAHGLDYAAQIQAPWLDVVIGKTRHTAGESTIYLEPVNIAPRSIVDVLASA